MFKHHCRWYYYYYKILQLIDTKGFIAHSATKVDDAAIGQYKNDGHSSTS